MSKKITGKYTEIPEEREKENPDFCIRQIELEMQNASANKMKGLESELKFYKKLKENARRSAT